jgi:hypothetical protein
MLELQEELGSSYEHPYSDSWSPYQPPLPTYATALKDEDRVNSWGAESLIYSPRMAMLNYDFLVNFQIFNSFSDHRAIVPDQMSWLSWFQEKMTMRLAPKLRRLAGRHLMSRELPPGRCDICSWLSYCEERIRKLLLLLLHWWSRDQLTVSSFLARPAPAKIIALHANSHLILGSKSQLQLLVFNHQLFPLHTRV